MKEKYPKCPKPHKLKKLMLVMEVKNTLCRNNGVSNVYTFCVHILRVLIFMLQGDMCILQGREERETSLPIRNRRKKKKYYHFPQQRWW